MSFDTFYFFIFFFFVFAAHRAAPAKGVVLLVASVLFYAAAGWRDTAIFAATIIANFVFSFLVLRGRLWLTAAIAANALLLAFFKYRDFALGSAWGEALLASQVIPLGVSFYTFQAIAYFVDLRRGTTPHERSFPRFVLFKAFFPQLIAGPIVRGRQLLPQLARQWRGARRTLPAVPFLAIACAGIIKKVVFADSISPVVDDIFTHGPNGAATAWFGVILFAFQIYFDFSGYSDMAVGLAGLLGIRLPLNFRQPYLATSPREFWQRWHITLSRWIRDYLYIPLGGSRAGGAVRQAAAVVLVMAIAGLWHGANWTFIVWGASWGLAIVFWRALPPTLPPVLAWPVTMALVLCLWVIFRAADLASALAYLATMAGGAASGSITYMATPRDAALAASSVLALLALHKAEALVARPRIWRRLLRLDPAAVSGALLAVMAWLLLLPKANLNPFIYFRF
jgi:alginate O-acetyltransferase complex protein AlgI